MLRHAFLLFILLAWQPLKAEYRFSTNCKAAYTLLWQFKIAETKQLLAVEQKNNPKNLLPLYLYDAADFFYVFATEEDKAYEQYNIQKARRLAKLEDGGTNNPYYYFCTGEIYLHSALLKVRFNDLVSAAWDVKKAYSAIYHGSKKFPDFLPLKRDLYMLQAAVGTVPENYRWMLKILGFSGDLNNATAQFSEVTNQLKNNTAYSIFHNESLVLQAYITHYLLNKPEEAWQLMMAATQQHETSAAHAFFRANLALREKKNETVLAVLDNYTKDFPPVPYMDYMFGLAKLQRGDGDAGYYIGRYIKNFKGHNYLKEAYLKLGWAFYLSGDTENYRKCLKLVHSFGTTIVDEDKNAAREARGTVLPHVQLLRARLLFDGGYFATAAAQMSGLTAGSFSTAEQKAEYHYRYARILEALGKTDDALEQYNIVIETYASLNEYFAPASSLYSGMLWEKRNNTAKALFYYRKCISYKNYMYKNSFDQKAYAGIKRLE